MGLVVELEIRVYKKFIYTLQQLKPQTTQFSL